MRHLALLAAVLTASTVAGCGRSETEPSLHSSGQDRPAHIHGLAIVDGQVLAAAHDGLWAVADGKASRVGRVRDDLMGLTVAGEGRLLASGHPAEPGARPPHLGLTESRDGGRSWKNVSLPGQADFHALAVAGKTVYGYDAGRLLASTDGGTTWKQDPIGADVISLAMVAGDDRRVLAGTAAGVQIKQNGRWKNLLAGQPAIVAWPTPRRMIAVALDGEISISNDAGSSWKSSGTTPGAPVAANSDGRALVAASEDGSISQSTDDGATWATLLDAGA